MPRFTYSAVDKAGKSSEGEIESADRREAIAELSGQGLLPVKIAEKSGSRFSDASIPFLKRGISVSRVSAIDKILIARHLSVILKTGISVREALDILYNDFQKPFIRRLIREARSSVEQGQPLSNFFASYPRYFPPVFVGLIRAGEASGTLDSAFENLYTQLFRDYDLVRRVRMAMIYPLILLTGSLGIIVLMMTFILPRMAKAFHGALDEMPFITKLLISISSYLGAYPLLTIIVFSGIMLGGFFGARSQIGRRLLFKLFERLPISSELIKKLALARFCRTLRNLLTSGVPAIEGIHIASTTVANPTYTVSFQNIIEQLRRGSTLSDVFHDSPKLYPSFFSSIIAIGERTGTLEQSLETLSSFYEEEVDRLLKSLVSLVEPLLIFIMGIVVALVALAVLLPIFRVVRTFQR